MPVLVDTMMVVSEMGEIWLPQSAPEKMAPSSGHNIGRDSGEAGVLAPLNKISEGTMIGINIIMEPNADPVIAANNNATKKIISGSKKSGIESISI